MELGKSVGELKESKDNSITDIESAGNIIAYAVRYKDENIVKKINSDIFKEAFINYINKPK